MKKSLFLFCTLLLSISLSLTSCRNDDSTPETQPEIPIQIPTSTFVFNNNTRTYPLKSNADLKYSYYAGWSVVPATQTQIERFRFQMEISDVLKKYIGDLGGYTGTMAFDVLIFAPKMTFNETPVSVPLKSGTDTTVTSTHATFRADVSLNSNTGIAGFWPVTGQSVNISKNGSNYIVDIPYLKLQDNFGKIIIMTGLKFEAIP